MPIVIVIPLFTFFIKLLSSTLFIYVAWTSTPGYSLATGTVFISNRLDAVEPKYIILFEKSKITQNTQNGQIIMPVFKFFMFLNDLLRSK